MRVCVEVWSWVLQVEVQGIENGQTDAFKIQYLWEELMQLFRSINLMTHMQVAWLQEWNVDYYFFIFEMIIHGTHRLFHFLVIFYVMIIHWTHKWGVVM